MERQIVARLKLLSDERRKHELPEKTVQIEKWISSVNQHSNHWKPSPYFTTVDMLDKHTPLLERHDSGLQSVSVSSRNSTCRPYRDEGTCTYIHGLAFLWVCCNDCDFSVEK